LKKLNEIANIMEEGMEKLNKAINELNNIKESEDEAVEKNEDRFKKIEDQVSGLENSLKSIPEILLEICRTIENQSGTNLIVLTKKIKNL